MVGSECIDDSLVTIELLRGYCANGNIKWSSPILARIQERNINPSDVKNCVLTGEIIERYPKDYPHPSYLILGFSVLKKTLHVVLGIGNSFLWLITAYYPDEKIWKDNYKIRKEVIK